MHTRDLGGNMKTRLAVYEDGLFDLRGAKLFKGGANAPSHLHPSKRNPALIIVRQ